MLSNLLSPIIIIFIIVFFLIFIICIFSYFECNSFKISKHTVKNTKNLDKTSFVFITDFHNKNYKNGYSKLINCILELDPYYIILGGDFINFSKLSSLFGNPDYENTVQFIRDLSQICKNISKNKNYNLKKIFFTFGNHELRLRDVINSKYEGQYDDFIKHLNENDIQIIDNDTVNLSDHINLSALSLYNGYYYNRLSKNKNFEHIEKSVLDKYFLDLKSDSFNIISFHKPDYFNDFLDYGFDLVLSGHNHGGLVRLPIIGSILTPDFKLFPKYDYGFFNIKNRHLIVSSGLGEHFLKLRLNNLPEICYVSIE